MKLLSTFLSLVLLILGGVAIAQSTLSATSTVHGCETLTVNYTLTTSTPITTIDWNYGDDTQYYNTNSLTGTHSYGKPGTYTVSVIINGTEKVISADLVEISAKPRFNFVLVDTLTDSPLHRYLGANIFNIDSVLFKPLQYSWIIEGTNLGNSNKQEYTFDSAGIFNVQLTISNSEGCSNVVNGSLKINEELIVPDVFTPNGDSKNETFKVPSINNYVLKFEVFNRYGLLLYKLNAKEIDWDGRLPSGEYVPVGVYFYVIEAQGANPPLIKKGFFHIYK